MCKPKGEKVATGSVNYVMKSIKILFTICCMPGNRPIPGVEKMTTSLRNTAEYLKNETVSKT
jgi:hypothetical protein